MKANEHSIVMYNECFRCKCHGIERKFPDEQPRHRRIICYFWLPVTQTTDSRGYERQTTYRRGQKETDEVNRGRRLTDEAKKQGCCHFQRLRFFRWLDESSSWLRSVLSGRFFSAHAQGNEWNLVQIAMHILTKFSPGKKSYQCNVRSQLALLTKKNRHYLDNIIR